MFKKHRFLTSFFVVFSPPWGSPWCLLGALFRSKTYEAAGVKRSWMRLADFWCFFGALGCSGSPLGTILAPFWHHFGHVFPIVGDVIELFRHNLEAYF